MYVYVCICTCMYMYMYIVYVVYSISLVVFPLSFLTPGLFYSDHLYPCVFTPANFLFRSSPLYFFPTAVFSTPILLPLGLFPFRYFPSRFLSPWSFLVLFFFFIYLRFPKPFTGSFRGYVSLRVASEASGGRILNTTQLFTTHQFVKNNL